MNLCGEGISLPDGSIFQSKMKNIFIITILVVFMASCKFSVFGKDDDASESSSDIGRYQIVFNPNAASDTFLLDTKTGRVWRNVKFIDIEGDPEVWREMDIIDDKMTMTYYSYDDGKKKLYKVNTGKTFEEFIKKHKYKEVGKDR
ncbi:MAG TPA: hypothetical protein DIV86_07725 [Alphaproteobacteria bacterium]|nr:hypothetical protein [Alphaproteobacteria bacterium]